MIESEPVERRDPPCATVVIDAPTKSGTTTDCTEAGRCPEAPGRIPYPATTGMATAATMIAAVSERRFFLPVINASL